MVDGRLALQPHAATQHGVGIDRALAGGVGQLQAVLPFLGVALVGAAEARLDQEVVAVGDPLRERRHERGAEQRDAAARLVLPVERLGRVREPSGVEQAVGPDQRVLVPFGLGLRLGPGFRLGLDLGPRLRLDFDLGLRFGFPLRLGLIGPARRGRGARPAQGADLAGEAADAAVGDPVRRKRQHDHEEEEEDEAFQG